MISTSLGLKIVGIGYIGLWVSDAVYNHHMTIGPVIGLIIAMAFPLIIGYYAGKNHV